MDIIDIAINLLVITDIDEIERKHLAAVQEAIDQQGSLTHTTAHGVIVGLARSGKDTLMKRFLGEMPSDKSPSTGVAEKVIQVRVEKPTTIAANVEDSKWTKLTEYDDEAVEMMTQLTAKQTQVKQKILHLLNRNIYNQIRKVSTSYRDPQKIQNGHLLMVNCK